MEKWASGITQVIPAGPDVIREILGNSPAAVNRETGVMYVNPNMKLNEDQWWFIMLHENGHLVKQTKDELQADKWAHEQYLKDSSRSLKQSVFALTDLLNFNKPEDMQRAYAQLLRAQEKDVKKMENFAGDDSEVFVRENEYNRMALPYGFSPYDSNYNEFFLGHHYAGNPPAMFDRAPNYSKLIGLEQITETGQQVFANLGKLFGGLPSPVPDNSSINAILQRQAQEDADAQAKAAADAKKAANNKMIVIGIVVIAVLMVVGGIFLLKK